MKKAIEIDRVLVESIITKLESEKEWPNPSILYKEVARVLEVEHSLKISPATVYGRVKQWGTQIKTKAGKRGEHLKGTGGSDALKQWQATGESPSKRVGDCSQLMEYFKKEEAAKYVDGKPVTKIPLVKMVKSIKRGSLKSAIKLMCLSCTHYDKGLVKTCEIVSCPLHPVRPYRQNLDEKIPE